MKNKIEDLRNHLFATIEGLLDEDKPMDVKRAQAVANVSNAIINSAKTELAFMKLTNSSGTGFIPTTPKKLDESEKAKHSSIKALKVAEK